MELHERSDGLVVVNDAYNANPDSMRAALETLAQLGARTGRRTVAVLGEMRELGEQSEVEHAAIGRALDELRISASLVIGPEARAIQGDTTHYVDSVAEAVAWLRHNVVRDDLVLVKASRGARLERVAEALLEDETDGRTEEEVER
jgi:UDP-N-acetylmuramoyl-tripeptide--D-alanyl-D-alanine ligase